MCNKKHNGEISIVNINNIYIIYIKYNNKSELAVLCVDE